MKSLNKEEASMRIFKIAKAVGEHEAISGNLSPLQRVKVRNTIAKILAATDLTDEELEKLSTIDLDEDKVNYSEAESIAQDESVEEVVEQVKEEVIVEADDEEEVVEQIEIDETSVQQSLKEIGKGNEKAFINGNKAKKLNSEKMANFISKLAEEGVEFKPSTLARVKFGQLFIALSNAIKYAVETNQ